jgi:hypothetical protein
MTAKSDQLAELRQNFAKQYAPDEPRRQSEFEIALDRLLYAAFSVAQEPFVRELEAFKKIAIEAAVFLPGVSLQREKDRGG